jgi:uncharacterized protein (DUF2336 family)
VNALLPILSDIDKVIAGASTQRRAAALLQVADLLIGGSPQFSEEAIELFDDVICRLAQHIETSVRVLLAHRIAPLPRAPFNITNMLASDDDISVAEPILIQSDRLEQGALITYAREKSQAHLLAIAQRRTLSEAVTDVLVERGDREVLLTAIRNTGAAFSETGFSRLATRSVGDEILTTCVGSRADIPREVLLRLIAAASELVRDKLLAEHPLMRTEVDETVTTVAADLKMSAMKVEDYATALAVVKSLSDSGQLTDQTIRALAEDRKADEAIASIAYLCRAPVDIIVRAFAEGQSEAILVFAKAAGLCWSTAKALLALHAGDRTPSAIQIARNMASFHRLNVATARQILEFYRTRRPTQALQYRTVAPKLIIQAEMSDVALRSETHIE